MPFADGNLVDADDFRPRRPRPPQLLLHVLLLQGLDRLPVQMELFGHVPNTRIPTATADIEGKSLGVKGRVGQPVQLFLLHLLAPSAKDAANLHVQVNPHIPAGQISNPADLSVVEGTMDRPAGSTDRFFPLRLSRMSEGPGVPEDTGNSLPRVEARKPIDVPELFMFCHVFFIALFSGPVTTLKPFAGQGF